MYINMCVHVINIVNKIIIIICIDGCDYDGVIHARTNYRDYM